MTRPVLILVTGSRALAGHDGARAWLRERLDALAPAVVVTGDARGPDAWALRWCVDSARVNSVVYALDGKAYHRRHHPRFGWEATYQWSDVPSSERPEPRRWPLVRNEAMVRFVAEETDAPAEVVVLALRASYATTQGTAHTIGLARSAGLIVEERVFDRVATLPGVG